MSATRSSSSGSVPTMLSGYRPATQETIVGRLSNRGEQSVTELQKATGVTREEVFEAVTDLASKNAVRVSRSNAMMTVEPRSGCSDVVTPVVPPRRVVFGKLPGKYAGEQRGERPAVVISDLNTLADAALVVVPLTSTVDSALEGTTKIEATETNQLDADSRALCQNVKTVSKTQIESVYGVVEDQFPKIQDELNKVLDL